MSTWLGISQGCLLVFKPMQAIHTGACHGQTCHTKAIPTVKKNLRDQTQHIHAALYCWPVCLFAVRALAVFFQDLHCQSCARTGPLCSQKHGNIMKTFHWELQQENQMYLLTEAAFMVRINKICGEKLRLTIWESSVSTVWETNNRGLYKQKIFHIQRKDTLEVVCVTCKRLKKSDVVTVKAQCTLQFTHILISAATENTGVGFKTEWKQRKQDTGTAGKKIEVVHDSL